MSHSSVMGAILVGGASRRMGMPKALLRVPEDGPTMLERVAQTLGPCCDEVVLVGRCPEPVPASLLDLKCVPDVGEGPLTGLAAALASTDHARVMLAGCDMPFLSAEIVRAIIQRSIDTGAGVLPWVAVDGADRRKQPLHAIYLREHLGLVDRVIAEGARSMAIVVDRLPMVAMAIDDECGENEAIWSCFNVNTPADLDVARRHARGLQRWSPGAILGTNDRDRAE